MARIDEIAPDLYRVSICGETSAAPASSRCHSEWPAPR